MKTRNLQSFNEQSGSKTDRKSYYLKNDGKVNVHTYNIYDVYKHKNKFYVPTTDTEIDFFKKNMTWQEI